MELSIILRPLVALIVVGFVLLPARLLVQNRMRDGRIKRLLLLRISSAYDGGRDQAKAVVSRTRSSA